MDRSGRHQPEGAKKVVIRLANRGFSVKDNAGVMCHSADSVKGYRKSLFHKLGVGSISEAIAVVKQRRLI